MHGQGGYFVRNPFLAAAGGDFGVAPALESAADAKIIPDIAIGSFLSRTAPKNAGKIVGAVISTFYCQHHVADFPPQRGAPISRLLAKRAFDDDLVDGLPVFADDLVCKNKDQQMPHSIFPDIVGAHLACDGQHTAA